MNSLHSKISFADTGFTTVVYRETPETWVLYSFRNTVEFAYQKFVSYLDLANSLLAFNV